METRKIGSLEVSVVGLGCNNFGRRLDAACSATVIHAALDAGITFFDTADSYGDSQSETILGRALGRRRDDVVIATKFGNPIEGQGQGASAEYIRRAVEASLRRLGTDRIDLYQLHKPDPAVPIEETLGALDELVQAGKVREIGCSNFSIEQLRAAEAVVEDDAARFESVQNEYSLLQRDAEREVLPFCERQGLAFLPYYPLASGLLTGKYRQEEPVPEGTRISLDFYSGWLNEENLARVEALIGFAEARGHTILELAFSWLLRWPSVASVIAGATSPRQVQANAAAAGWQLTEADLAEIDAIAYHGA
ncbi:MAG: aldo/keto reductase [Chloroflexota bacterium]|nr:aldo/keto reductase [Chloroflexota bacterium]